MMSSLYAKYKKERENKETLENDYGFCIYEETPLGIYIEDLYVLPEVRKSGIASNFANEVKEIAKSKGLTYLFTSADKKALGWETSVKAIESYGFKLIKQEGTVLWYRREIE